MSIKLKDFYLSTLFIIFVYNFIYLNICKLINYIVVDIMNKWVINILICDEISTIMVDKVVKHG